MPTINSPSASRIQKFTELYDREAAEDGRIYIRHNGWLYTTTCTLGILGWSKHWTSRSEAKAIRRAEKFLARQQRKRVHAYAYKYGVPVESLSPRIEVVRR